MQVTFYGAAREVTGSMHLLNTYKDNILLDCGMFQGKRSEANEKNRGTPFDPSIITNIVLSHAHIDHSGRIPLMVKKGFSGRVFSTRATKDACDYLLTDSAHIQESDAQYMNYKTVRNGISRLSGGQEKRKFLKSNKNKLNHDKIQEYAKKYDLKTIEPLYGMVDAENALSSFQGIPYRTPVTIGKDMTCTFYEAGHILGSAICMIKHNQGGVQKTICYTGDVGRYDKPIIKDPNMDFLPEDRNVDLLITESTYGNRIHEPSLDLKDRLMEVLSETLDRGGSVVIPSFAFGRTQELLYFIHELYDEGKVPRVPVYVDSPLATKLTKVFGEHPEVYDSEAHETFLQKGRNPFMFEKIEYTASVEDSMRVMREKRPHIVISASGMCEAGRILHHLRYKIHNPDNTLLIVGYMAAHTLGRRMLNEGMAYQENGKTGDAPMVKIYGKEYPLKAHIAKIGGFSAHADKQEMLKFLQSSNLTIKKAAVVHGEEDQSLEFAKELNTIGIPAEVPRRGESINL